MTKLPPIPEVELPGPDWPGRLLAAERGRAAALLEAGTAGWPPAAVRAGDAMVRRWLARSGNPYAGELERLAGEIGRPGGLFLNLSHEWGCTTRAGPTADVRAARLIRVLDWPQDGLGRWVVAAHLEGPAGRWTNLTWAGFAGVVQASAPGRFAAAFNQAPQRAPTGLMPLDWLGARRRLWRSRGLPPAHLLRLAFETCRSFAEARELLTDHPLALPAIFVLAGTRPEETCTIERLEGRAHRVDGPSCAANHFTGHAGAWRARGDDSPGRAAALAAWLEREADADLAFLAPPVLNPTTRLAMVAEPAHGKILAQGLERDGPATYLLRSARAAAPAAAGASTREVAC
jgi:hypothetical protein